MWKSPKLVLISDIISGIQPKHPFEKTHQLHNEATGSLKLPIFLAEGLILVALHTNIVR